MRIRAELDDSTAATIHSVIVSMRALDKTKEDPVLDGRLRDAELALAGSLRSIGWQPRPDGTGWVMRGAPHGRR